MIPGAVVKAPAVVELGPGVAILATGYLRRCIFDFIRTLAPALTPEVVRAAVQAHSKNGSSS